MDPIGEALAAEHEQQEAEPYSGVNSDDVVEAVVGTSSITTFGRLTNSEGLNWWQATRPSLSALFVTGYDLALQGWNTFRDSRVGN